MPKDLIFMELPLQLLKTLVFNDFTKDNIWNLFLKDLNEWMINIAM